MDIAKKEILHMLRLEAKSLVATYATLQSSILSVVKVNDQDMISEAFNGIIETFLKEFALVGIEQSDIIDSNNHEYCIQMLSEKVRVTKALVDLFFSQILDEETLNEFLEAIDDVEDEQKKVIDKIMSDGAGCIQ